MRLMTIFLKNKVAGRIKTYGFLSLRCDAYKQRFLRENRIKKQEEARKRLFFLSQSEKNKKNSKNCDKKKDFSYFCRIYYMTRI